MIQGNVKFYRCILALLLSVAVTSGSITIPAAAATLPMVTSRYFNTDIEELTEESELTQAVSYLDANGQMQSVMAVKIEGGVSTLNLSAGWYYTDGDVTLQPDSGSAIDIYGDVHIILTDNSHLRALGKNYGVGFAYGSLSIYAQSTGDNMGALTATANSENFAGIGCESGKSFTVYGGAVSATSGSYGAGIGGGKYKTGGTITISGGTVTATGVHEGAGIGGGQQGSGGRITIRGGMVIATNSDGGDRSTGAGIGGGLQGSGGTITIDGGTVIANGNSGGAGIGGGHSGSGGNITINGGTVMAASNYFGAGIGGGDHRAGENITINGGTVTATGGYLGAGIGGGNNAAGGNITINGGTVTAKGHLYAVDIGGGRYGQGGVVVINGGSIKVSTIQSQPINSNGENVYLGKLENQSGVQSVSVDECPFGISANHEDDDSLYIYVPDTNHKLDVKTDSGTTRYIATNNGGSFIFESGETQEHTSPTGVSLSLSRNTAECGDTSGITVTATVADSSLGDNGLFSARLAGLNQVAFYMDDATEPFSVKPVIGGNATTTIDISGWNIGEYNIKARYGGSFGGAASESSSAMLTISKKTLTAADLIYSIPTEHVYNGTVQGIGDVTSVFSETGPITVKYSGSETIPVNSGNYTVTVDIADSTSYYASSFSLGNYIIAPKPVTITPDSNQEKFYGENDPKFTYTSSEALSFNGALSRVQGEDAGTYAIVLGTLSAGSNYELSLTGVVDFTVKPQSNAVFTIAVVSPQAYTGSAIMPKPEVYDGITVLTSGIDFNYSYENNTDAGNSATITVTGIGNYMGSSGSITFTIQADHSSDDSGSGAPAVVPSAKSNQPTAASVNATARVKNGNAALTITDSMVKTAIEEALTEAKVKINTTNGISIDISVTATKVTGFAFTLERTALNRLLEAEVEVKAFRVSGLPVHMSFNTAALEQLQAQSGGNLIITAKPAKVTGLRNAFNITISSTKNGKAVSIISMGDGSVALGISTELGKNESGGYLYGAYVGADKKNSRIAQSVYDAGSGNMIFSTSHFSVYGVGYAAPSAKFTDITNYWAKEAIEYVVGRGILTGTTETTFEPEAAMTRGTLVTALGRLAGVDAKAYRSNSFSDVKADSVSRPYIEWAYRKGIIQSVGNGKFAPDKAVAREEIALIFANYFKVTGYTMPVTRNAAAYTDASSIGSIYKTAVTVMQQAGIMMGGIDNKFNPKSSATRAEISSMLHRYIKLSIDPATAQGWAKNDAGQYLYYKDGSMVRGKWFQIDDKWYYFYADGSLARSTRIGEYEVDASGVRKIR